MRSRWSRTIGVAWLAIHAVGVFAQQHRFPEPADMPMTPAFIDTAPRPVPQPAPTAVASDAWTLARFQAIENELAMMRAHGLGTAPCAAHVPSSQACPPCELPGCGGWCLPADDPGSPFPQVRLSGLFQLDWGAYDQDAANRSTLGDIENGLGFRRARLAATGKVSKNTAYIMEFDFAQAQARFVDVWTEFQETPLGNLRIGRYRQPFGMAELTSIRGLPFLERPLPFALAPFRQTGAMLHDTALGESVTWAVSGYRYLSDNFGNVYADSGGHGLAARLTGLLIDRGDDGLVHLGAGYSYNDAGRDAVQYVSTNEFFVGQNPLLGPAGLGVLPILAVPPFVDTGAVPTANTSLHNLEAAIGRGNMVVQSEVRWARVDNLVGADNTFPGAYAHFRYVLTGEAISYNRDAGVFGRVKPRHPVDPLCGYWGAWEVAARVSYLDLNGTGLPGPGRRLTDWTLGLSWYVNDFTKFQLNWIQANLDDPVLGSSDAYTYATRAQLDF